MMKGKIFLDVFLLFCKASFRDENFLAKEFDGFPLAFSPCRVQGKPKVACFCIVLLYVHIEILAVLVPVI